MKKIIVGLLIADEWEFVPFEKWVEKFDFKKSVRYKNQVITFDYNENISVVAVESGVGKVNAAFAASYMISEYKCDMILNIGLSGAIKNVGMGEIVAGTDYIECDFDLTATGKKPGLKPNQEYHYKGDEKLLEIAKKCSVDSFEPLGTGDIFLTDREKKIYYRDTFNISAFDMETGAIAAVCHKTRTPFLSLRKISDNCDDYEGTYKKINERAEIHLSNIFEEMLKEIAESYCYEE